MYKEGLKKKPLDHNLPRNPKVPEDLAKELKKNKIEKQFKELAPSYRRYYIWSVMRAKRDEIKKKRIDFVVDRVKKGKKFGED